jgi:hypothetical protein
MGAEFFFMAGAGFGALAVALAVVGAAGYVGLVDRLVDERATK